jgi:hypothetical protein
MTERNNVNVVFLAISLTSPYYYNNCGIDSSQFISVDMFLSTKIGVICFYMSDYMISCCVFTVEDVQRQ